MTRLTGLIIQTNGENVVCDSAGPDKFGKYAGWISLFKDGSYHSSLLSTNGIYDSTEEAEKKMKNLVEEIRAMDLT